MVVICERAYENIDNDSMNEHFEKFPFPLSDFQKYAIDGIVHNHHVLVTAHTGSGKTLPAEFAIDYFCKQKKKVIYTSPIKALSNEKYHDFCKKFPDYNVGILTGDIKFNPNADIIIMTTEILQNHLYKRNEDKTQNTALSFEMDIDNELACVIFDEVHYINDADRGKVWEETILMLPEHVSMLMLSATIDKPEHFAKWCEDRHKNSTKKVFLVGTDHRVVPLKHYIYIDSTEHYFKLLKDKDKEKEIKSFIKKPQLIKEKSKINDDIIHKSNKLLSQMTLKGSHTKPSYILNSLIKYLYQENMLPGICFVFSRLNVEKYANQIQVNLFGEEDSHIPSIIPKECDKIIRKLPNYEEYKNLDEYKNLVQLMSKGVAIHHSGMMPILREIVEIIFGKKYIKVLFATETFAVGINMPTKTVIFTALTKFTSNGVRNLLSHEYTQMAGRAGRRGLDTVGHVIHCNNMFRENMSLLDYKNILSGKPQSLQSKFKISYSFLLNLIAVKKTDFCKYVQSSMMNEDLMKYLKGCEEEGSKLAKEYDSIYESITSQSIDIDSIQTYITTKETIQLLNNKKRKVAIRSIEEIEAKHGKQFNMYLDIVKQMNTISKSMVENKRDIESANQYVNTNVQHVINILTENNFVITNDEGDTILSPKGIVSSCVHEIHPLVISEMIYDGSFTNASMEEIVAFFSIFTNLKVNEEYREPSRAVYVKDMIQKYHTYNNSYMNHEEQRGINTGHDMEIHEDVTNECMDWCSADDEVECKQIVEKLRRKEIFVGEFVKAILKINNIANECIHACEVIGDVALAEKLNSIQKKTLKYIILQQSLYV